MNHANIRKIPETATALRRILRDQAEAARVLAGLPAGHRDIPGVRAGIADALLEEAVLRTGRLPRVAGTVIAGAGKPAKASSGEKTGSGPGNSWRA